MGVAAGADVAGAAARRVRPAEAGPMSAAVGPVAGGAAAGEAPRIGAPSASSRR